VAGFFFQLCRKRTQQLLLDQARYCEISHAALLPRLVLRCGPSADQYGKPSIGYTSKRLLASARASISVAGA